MVSGRLSRRWMLGSLGGAGLAGGSLGLLARAAPAAAREAVDEAYERGLELLRRIEAEEADAVLKELTGLSPDFARLHVEHAYGEVLSRPGLDLRHRELIAISALLAAGSVQSHVKRHMSDFLSVGGRPQELVELLYVAMVTIGFPVPINAISIVRQVFKDRGLSFVPTAAATDDGTDRYQRGLAALAALGVSRPERMTGPIADVAPELARWSVEFMYGEILSRDGLDAKSRQIAIVAMLATAGNRPDALRFHVDAGLKVGLSAAEIGEILLQLTLYAGLPAVQNALIVASGAFKDHAAGVARPVPAAAPVPVPSAVENREVRMTRAVATMSKTSSASGQAVVHSFDDVAPDMGRLILEHAYGDIFSRTGIESRIRELTSVAATAAIGSKTQETPLRVHTNAALNAGATREEVIETLLNLTPYCGYPLIQQAMRIVGEEFAKRPA